ncbi:putative alpha/beta hydrolase domain-containing protein [Streptomyces sp. Tu6071]|uniref:alpha/beta hydrolase n=3 Tax=Streptomyces TaxID=1883 RepID=UPI00020E632A|nr:MULTISPECIES: alpha/beta hydrolase [unclassified Streptomyces]ASY34282.1 esterase [Streptomyces sp. CLI2509]EGJ76582.1 putative alpha/beta hydrolase domain-containing protein [Streptomyces sp. Tu6071]
MTAHSEAPTPAGQVAASPRTAPAPLGPPPPFDPELAAVLDTFPGVEVPSLEEIPAMRGTVLGNFPVPTLDELRAGGEFEIEKREVPGPAGDPDITLYLCRPADATGAIPVLYHTHGGGMILGDALTGLPQMLDEWTRDLGIGIVSVEYRLAPEHPDPAPVEDCYAGLVWTAEHAAELGFDPERIIIGGGSAGGGLAAGVALAARDRGGPALLGQLLMCPMLDDRNDTPSAVQMAGTGLWDREANHMGWTALLGERRGGPDVSPYAAPARAVDLAGLPPAFVDVGSAETFRDEDVAYASRLWACGVQTELHVWPGGFHGFDGIAPQAALSQTARTTRTEWLRRLLGE